VRTPESCVWRESTDGARHPATVRYDELRSLLLKSPVTPPARPSLPCVMSREGSASGPLTGRLATSSRPKFTGAVESRATRDEMQAPGSRMVGTVAPTTSKEQGYGLYQPRVVWRAQPRTNDRSGRRFATTAPPLRRRASRDVRQGMDRTERQRASCPSGRPRCARPRLQSWLVHPRAHRCDQPSGEGHTRRCAPT
jgi:hypothetical protein